MIGESGFEAQASRIIVSGYSGVCFEIKFSGRHRGFDGVLDRRLSQHMLRVSDVLRVDEVRCSSGSMSS